MLEAAQHIFVCPKVPSMFRISRSLRTLFSDCVAKQTVQSLRPERVSFPAALPLFQHAYFSSRGEKKVMPTEAKEISKGLVLPPVTREDTKEMSTAEICLYLKARKFHNYDVVKREGNKE